MTNTKINTFTLIGLYEEDLSIRINDQFHTLKKEPYWKQRVYNLLISLESVRFDYSIMVKDNATIHKMNLSNLDDILECINDEVDPSQTETYFSKEEFMQFYNEQFSSTTQEEDLFETKVGSFNLGKLADYIKLDGSLFDRLMSLETLILNNQSNGIFIKSDEYTMKDIMESITHSIVLAISKCYVNGYMKDIILDTSDLEKYSKYKTPEPVINEETYLIDDVINTSATDIVEEPKVTPQQSETTNSGARKIKVERPKPEEKAPEEAKVTETQKLQHPDIKVTHNPDKVDTKVKGNKPQTNPEKKKETPQNVKKGIVATDFLMSQNDKINIINTINHINNNIEATLAANWNLINNIMITNAQLVADVNTVWGNTVANIVDMNTKCNMPIIEEVFRDFNLQLEAQIYNAISSIVNRQNMVMYIISQINPNETIQDTILRTFYSYIMDSFTKLTTSINCYMIARGTDVNEIKVEEIVKKVNSIIPTPIDANIITKNIQKYFK